MFLGSGSVIHGMHDEQNITKMGGLKNKMKVTYFTFFIGALAISGIPPLSGFFSKDEIMWKTFENTGIVFYIIVLFTAVLTAFYMFRLIGLTFYGKPRYDEKHIEPHESPKVMTIPLIILSVLSVIGGFIGFPHYLGIPNILDGWLEPVFKNAYGITETYRHIGEQSIVVELIFVIISITVALIAIYFSFKKYSVQDKFKDEKGFGKVLERKYYLDEIYEKSIVKPIQVTSEKFLWNIFDVKIIDGAVNGIASYFGKLSIEWRKLQTGVVQDYATVAIVGVVLILLFVLFV